MGFWEFWRKKKERRQNPAEDSSIDNGKTVQNSGIQEPVLAQAKEDKEQDDDFRYDREHHKPVIRSSICTGEQVAGFKDRRTGRFMEIMLIRDNKDIEAFTREYNISREEITREW